MSPKVRFLLVVVLALVAADQVTKFLAVRHLTTALERSGAEGLREEVAAFYSLEHLDASKTPPYPVVDAFWAMKYVENPGAAWGLFARAPEPFRRIFFYVVSVVAIVLISTFYARLQPGQTVLTVALALVLGGAVGNFIDRLVRGYVIDFIDWHWFNDPDLHWPTFNVADSAISVGVVLMIAEPFLQKRLSRAADTAAAGER